MHQRPNPRQASDRRPAPFGLIVLLMAMSAIGPVSLNILVPATPGLAVLFDTSVETVQLTLSLYLFGLAVSQLLLGPLSDRFGRKPVLLAGLFITAVASVAAIFSTSIGMLIVLRTLQALGASSGLVIGRAIIRDLYTRDRAAAMIGLVTTVMVLAPMAAPLIGGILDTAFRLGIHLRPDRRDGRQRCWSGPISTLPETRPDHITGGGLRFILRESRELLSRPEIRRLCAGLRDRHRDLLRLSRRRPACRDQHHGAHLGRIRDVVHRSHPAASCSAISSPRASRSATASTA